MTQTQVAHFIESTQTGTQQQILLDARGFVLESTDAIFRADRQRPATEWSDFFASLLDFLAKMPQNAAEIELPKIASVTNFKSGLFDCSFMRVQYCDVDSVIVWNIVDQTHRLEDLQRVQQRFNEMRF